MWDVTTGIDFIKGNLIENLPAMMEE